jgi:hypothetical protein
MVTTMTYRPANPPARHLHTSQAAIVLSLFFGLAPSAPAAAQDQPGVEATGLSSTRAYLSVLPWESIDVYSGSLVLTYTDLVLPGNAGFDLAVTRVYNSKRQGGWRIGPGMIRYADAGSPGGHSTWNPKVVTADGAEHATFELQKGAPSFARSPTRSTTGTSISFAPQTA